MSQTTINTTDSPETGRVAINANFSELYGSIEVPRYVAIINQAETSAPTATILENLLSGTPVWTREGVGIYKLALTGGFTVGKTIVKVHNAHDGVDDKPYLTVWNKSLSTNDCVIIQNYVSSTRLLSDMNDVGDNGDCAIEISVYP